MDIDRVSTLLNIIEKATGHPKLVGIRAMAAAELDHLNDDASAENNKRLEEVKARQAVEDKKRAAEIERQTAEDRPKPRIYDPKPSGADFSTTEGRRGIRPPGEPAQRPEDVELEDTES